MLLCLTAIFNMSQVRTLFLFYLQEHLFDISDLHQDPPLISKCGNLEVTFLYNAEQARMTITILQARDIPSKDRGGANNAQVRLLLLPTKKQRHKTKIKPGDNPEFGDQFQFNKIQKGNEFFLNKIISNSFSLYNVLTMYITIFFSIMYYKANFKC